MREATQYSGEEDKLDSVTLIRVVAGVLAVIVLFIIVWRRKRKLSA